ncbi:PREDICTED: Fc receptor-like protein 1 [Condylura cristata]|uniref:Fc receptor-like protein 1 n=1 Tax=Condylura cristata TaxID=143302 RepID=UPI00064395EC|nr:PREDICTED: Fc receptor-like protein 1 [Condylura cristata]
MAVTVELESNNKFEGVGRLLEGVLSLTASPSQPIEGNTVTLNCTVQPWSWKLSGQLLFSFYKDSHILRPALTNSSVFQITATWKKKPGSYHCSAKSVKPTPWATLRSNAIYIKVQRVPVSNVSLEIQPSGGHVVKGEKLVLICSVPEGTGDITFSWYRGSMGLNMETKTQRLLQAKFEIAAVQESDTDQYYCSADNGEGPRLSELVSITVKIPVSRPVLTLGAPTQAVVGDVLELHCEAQRGSPPIRYHFYHEDVILGSSSAPAGGGVSFNLSLTAEHSGNYTCEADNGVGAQRSEVETLSITVPVGDRRDLLPSGVIEGLLSIVGLTTVALLFCYWLKRKKERRPVIQPRRSPPNPVPQELTYLNSPVPVQRDPVYQNVNFGSGDKVYSRVYQRQHEYPSTAVEPAGTHNGYKDSAIYSKLKEPNITDVDITDVDITDVDITDVDYENAV